MAEPERLIFNFLNLIDDKAEGTFAISAFVILVLSVFILSLMLKAQFHK